MRSGTWILTSGIVSCLSGGAAEAQVDPGEFNRAVLWLPDPDPEAYPFVGFDLNTVPIVWCESCLGGASAQNKVMILIRANDINNARQIVGAGSRNDLLNGLPRAYILTPRDPDCPADVDNDGDVDQDDMTDVILYWNDSGCGTPLGCTDVDRDGDTDTDDLTDLILAWGDCSGETSGGDPEEAACEALMALLDLVFPESSPIRAEILEAVEEMCE